MAQSGIYFGVALLGLLVTMTAHGALVDVNRCLPGPFHKYYPSPESLEFPECHAFAENSCCQYHIADEIAKHGAKNLYGGYHWDRCGPLSDACLAFIADEECFYQCEPSLSHFADPDFPDKGYIKNVPICASFCDASFEACRNDKTCVVDWLNDFNYSQSEYHCPTGSTCRTFEEVYGNGEGLCNKMWGHAFFYEKDKTKCMLMHFDHEECENPNACARDDVICDAARYEGCGSSAIGPVISLVCLFAFISFYFK